MGAEDKSEKAYDKKADNYNNTFDGRFTEKFKHILQNEVVLQKNYKLLDVACGNGELVSRFLKNNDIKGFGIDISGNMIKNAKLLCPQGSFKKSNCEHTGFERNFFDVITVPPISITASFVSSTDSSPASFFCSASYSAFCAA